MRAPPAIREQSRSCPERHVGEQTSSGDHGENSLCSRHARKTFIDRKKAPTCVSTGNMARNVYDVRICFWHSGPFAAVGSGNHAIHRYVLVSEFTHGLIDGVGAVIIVYSNCRGRVGFQVECTFLRHLSSTMHHAPSVLYCRCNHTMVAPIRLTRGLKNRSLDPGTHPCTMS